MTAAQRRRSGFTLVEVVVGLAVFLVVAGLTIGFLASTREAVASLSRLARQEAATTSLLRHLRADAAGALGFSGEAGGRVRFRTPGGDVEYEISPDAVTRRVAGTADRIWSMADWKLDLRPVAQHGGPLLDVAITGRKGDSRAPRQPWTLRTTLRAMGS